MESFELKISIKDWLYIITIAAFFGFLISIFFYFLNQDLQKISTMVFSTSAAIIIAIFSSILISISNSFILPLVNKQFWYLISFLFSFLSGALGFLFSYFLFSYFSIKIIEFIEPFYIYISITIGFLTFLIGLILHQFISMKYKNEFIRNEILESKLKALENELNPHFLFNALNSISELIYIDKKKAEDSVLNVSKFLRNALNTDSLVSTSKELDMVKTYVNIENTRFEDKIKLNINNNKDYEDRLIPKFSIQLLVENAIKHGFEGKELDIDITISKETIEVSNNGKIEEFVKYGTGLKNLDKRLELLKVGNLDYDTDEKMKFIIRIKSESINS
ncbi:sensor histidine kinase [Poseidonibacter lekithochrous]|uniref:sensor histidine kinase n=1 Tax=Poseidonibacter lekithochrous TaxID=1904463 RepID=UPI0008FC2A67|nr:histidine kinase [Poseidonibacter lekithochrous]QKJ23348.1 two-component system sensor histidine kinase, LytS/YehU family [Poseidonibacter lekithochrous]